MTGDGIGRLLVVSLHQSIGEVLPARLEYYEHWLTPMGLKDGRSGLAPLGAVLSFLRREGEASYTAVMRTAGALSAEWHHADERTGGRLLGWLPRRMRARVVLRRSRGLLRAAFQPLDVAVSSRRGDGVVTLTHSVFCTLREPWPWPTCAYVAGALEKYFALHGLTADVQLAGCEAQGASHCTLTVTLASPAAGEIA
ncbi:MAG: hypothetical protein AB7O28_02955 [Vicinamibacterales bacterium]